MMKQGIVLLAVCLAGMASAISVSWNGNTAVKAGKTDTLSTTTTPSESITNLSIVISGMTNASWVATQTGARLFTVYGANGTAGANGIETGGSEAGSGTTSKSYFDFYVAENGELGWGLAGNKGGNATNSGYKGRTTGWKITDLFNGTEELTLTFNKTSNLPTGLSLAKTDGTSVTLADDTNAFGFASGYVWNKITVTSLPEPGALALLALGVAGLALRRKVA